MLIRGSVVGLGVLEVVRMRELVGFLYFFGVLDGWIFGRLGVGEVGFAVFT